MTIEQYKAQPFKDATIGDYWYTFSRQMREVLTGKDVEEANRNPRMPFPSVYGQIMSRYDALLDAEE